MIINFDNVIESYKDILDKLSDLDIYEKYLGQSINLNKLYKCINPNHKDTNPSMGFYQSGQNINFKCFGCGCNGNQINFIKTYYNCEFKEAINYLKKDFKLDSIITTKRSDILTEKRYSEIIPTYRNWKLIDFEYWNQFGITLEQCLDYNIHPCKQVNYINKLGEYKLWAEHSNSNPIYCYEISAKYECYRPYNQKKGKWLANTTNFDIRGLEQLKDSNLLIITSSLKDVMVLANFGYTAISCGGEGKYIPEKVIDYLYSKYDNIIIFYDNDEQGLNYGEIQASNVGCDYRFIPIIFQNTKDISDFYKKWSKKITSNLLKYLF
jgi:DNA primase